MTDEEKEARQGFYRETGKTPEQEGRDAARMLGGLMVVAIAVAVCAAAYLTKSWLGY